MPNWCSNRLLVEGLSFEEFKKLYYEDGTFTFNKVIPAPEDAARLIEEWGTKWDCSDWEVFDYETGEGFTADFTTAWSPPNPIVQRLMENHPDAKIKLMYYESGCDFCGVHNEFGDSEYPFMKFDFEIKNLDEDLKSYIEYEREWFDEEEEDEEEEEE